MKPRKISPRDLGFYILIFVILISVVYLLAAGTNLPEIENYSEVRRLFENGDVEDFSIKDNVLSMRLTEA